MLSSSSAAWCSRMDCWNKKILDYEIETEDMKFYIGQPVFVEIKRFSITRLKPYVHQTIIAEFSLVEIKRFSITRLKLSRRYLTRWRLHRWNKKILDYEIETIRCWLKQHNFYLVEIKRFSITRLKLSHRGSGRYRWRWVEIKRFSITRLKHGKTPTVQFKVESVEIKRFSITRLKPMLLSVFDETFGALK